MKITPAMTRLALGWSVPLFAALVAFAGVPLRAADDVVTLTYPGSNTPGELACEANYFLWLPPGVRTVRGVIVHQHGCGDGAERGCLAAAEDLHWRALAEKHNCALLGTSYRAGDSNCGAWADPRRGSHQRFLQALRDLSVKTKHPEIADAPWCLWGHSGGGWWASMMLALEPERCVAVWLRSGSAYGGVLGPNKEAPPEPPAAAWRVPVMGNPGAREQNDPKFTNAYANTLGTFREWRAKGALIGFAPDPRSNHDCGGSRYLAIPFFDACLTARLPAKSGAPLQAMPTEAAWLAPLLGDTARPAADFTGDKNLSVWLPNKTVAQAWSDYVKTAAVSDTTPPPAPFNVSVQGGVLTWQARADFESGLRGFIIECDGQPLATLPEKLTERTVFQGLSFHDTPSQPVPPMRFTNVTARPDAKHRYTIRAVNTAGLKSEPAETRTR